MKTGSSGGVSGKSKPPMKVSARKLAKRSFGVGDILQMLRRDGTGKLNNGKNDIF